ncbi:MAG: DUF523 domain-containing protein [Deltaproteobacteria bacterium]|nr:DUF523 domain-containing protein [Deltaproteobacteria bacterium]MBW1951667.1 DUF523 domain-containing protein [Deltaproteobacteria bacterium]MBW1985766.1 DUF523 domain-containing protein [Deltaproteobacteria bacterium]MBW2134681.1 DUF523 domain-containing protein [Deltaproteobacteria bacterium]
MVVISACLVGIPCRYNGGHCQSPALIHCLRQIPFLALCPEVLGGLSVPRRPAEIKGGDGFDVLAGRAYLINDQGQDVTPQFLAGAYRCLELVRSLSSPVCYLKARSPSCGWTESGETNGVVGVFAGLLVQEGYRVIASEADCRIDNIGLG